MAADPASTLTRRQFLVASAGVAGMSFYGASSQCPRDDSPAPRPPSARSIRVALITDMHGPHNWIGHQELVDQVNRFQPDVVCIAGDAVDDRGDEPQVSRYAGIQARLGKFATLGNWEYQGECNLRRLRQEYERAGVRLLVNDRVRLQDPRGPVDLLGLDDWRAGAPGLRSGHGHGRRGPGATRAIVMSHCPVAFERSPRSRIGRRSSRGPHARWPDRTARMGDRAARRQRPLRPRPVSERRHPAHALREPRARQLRTAVPDSGPAGARAATV